MEFVYEAAGKRRSIDVQKLASETGIIVIDPCKVLCPKSAHDCRRLVETIEAELQAEVMPSPLLCVSRSFRV